MDIITNLTIIPVILALVLLCCIIFFIYKTKNIIKIDKDTQTKNNILIDSNIQLKEERSFLNKTIRDLKSQKSELENEYNNAATSLDHMRNQISNLQKDMEKEAKQAFDRYCEILEQTYAEKETEYDLLIKTLKSSYDKINDDLRIEQDKELKELAAIRATREAAIAAQIKEQEIKEQLDFYCLKPSKSDLNDIEVLNTIKPKLNKPRILSMLIWSTFFQKEMTALCNNILGLGTVIGIYKITNQQTGKCYIGQSVDVSKRWKDHAKCGLGIDTPAGNKLYKDMQEFGIWNFSWELLEKCSKEELNDKERNYIELYQSKEYGYNTTKGVK